MRPVIVPTTAPQSPGEVFGFRDALGDHELFTDQFLVDWQLSGPRSRVSFELAWLEAPLIERLAAPLTPEGDETGQPEVASPARRAARPAAPLEGGIQ
jgi:hypothetical protein